MPSAAIRLALVIYISLLLVAVLSPAEIIQIEPTRSPLSLQPGWLADGLRNVILFVPLGLAFMAFGQTPRFAIALGLAVSFAIELAQVAIPGRFASPVDLLFNSLGTALGAGIQAMRHILIRPRPRLSVRLSLAASALSSLTLLASTYLLLPVVPASTYFGGWTPELGHLAHYSGDITEARLGTLPIPPAGPFREQRQVHAALSRNEPVLIRGVAGDESTSLAPLVTVHDERQREILLVGLEGESLVVNRLRRTFFAGLESPSSRTVEGLHALSPGKPFTLALSLTETYQAASLDDSPVEFAPWTPGRSWFLIVPSSVVSRRAAPVFDLVWIAMLAFPASFWAGRRPGAWMGFSLLVSTLVLVPWFGPLASSPVREWLAFVASTVVAIYSSTRLAGKAGTAKHGPLPKGSD